MHPLRAAGGEDRPAACVATQDGGAVLLEPLLRALAVEGLGHPQQGLVALNAEPGGSRPEDLERVGRAVAAGGHRQAVLQRELTAVALVADDCPLGAQPVAALQAGARKGPVVGAMDRVTAVAAMLEEAMIAAVGEADAGKLVLR